MTSPKESAESPAYLISRLLQLLTPFNSDIPPGDPFTACHLLDRLRNGIGNNTPSSSLGSLWPRLPAIVANSYTLAQATLPETLPVFDCGPIQLVNIPGTNAENQQVPPLPLCRHVCNHVIAYSGEVAFARTDITLPGPLTFQWQRFYRHSNREDTGLGPGWRHTLSERLQIQDGQAELHTAEGRLVRFKIPPIGHSCYNRFERLLLHRQSLHSYRIVGFNQPARIFRSDGVNNALPLSEIRDQFGNALSIDYREGLPKKIASSWGTTLEFHYRDGHIEKLVNTQVPENPRELCHYSFEGQQLAEALSESQRERYEYCEEHRLHAIDSNREGKLHFHYDDQGRCCELHRNQLSHRLHWRRAEKRCTLLTDSRYPVEWKFNSAGQLIEEKQQDRHRRWLYDLYGNLCQEVAPDGQRTIYRYDELGRLTRCTRHEICDRYVYNQQGFLVAIQYRGEQVWRFRFDARGCPKEIRDPENQTWQCHYSERGQLLQIRDPEGGLAQFDWDHRGQLKKIQLGDRNWTCEYDDWLRPTALSANGEVLRSWHYGEKGELRSVGLGGYNYHLKYGEDGRPQALHRDNGESLHWQYDAAGRCREIRFADNSNWKLHYDSHGQLLELETGSGSIRWHYDGFGQITFREDPDGRQRQWLYQSDGKVREYRDNDIHWYFHYSENGTVAQIRNNSGQQCKFLSDQYGRLVQAENAYLSLQFQYDRRNRLTGELHNYRDSENLCIKYEYDARGWLTKIASEKLTLTYILTPDGNLYGLDANGEAVLRCEEDAASSVWVQGGLRSRRNYRSGQLLGLEAEQETDTPLNWHFEEELPLRLTPPEQFQPSSQNIGFLRNKHGNIVREFRRENQREYLYQYDGWGLLESAECGEFKIKFRYDPFGRRLSKLCTHRKSAQMQRLDTRWCCLGLWSEIPQFNDTQQTPRHYLYHPVNHTLLCRWCKGTTEHYLIGPQGQILALTDNSGVPLWVRLATTEQQGSPDPWRDRGFLADVETGLWYCPLGYWHPLLQTWLNTSHS